MSPFKRIAIILGWVVSIAIVLYFPSWDLFPSEEKSINIFAWGDTLDSGVLSSFEKKTGIKVNLSFYSSNEELLVKMKATGGFGYDLILPSDYTVRLLAEEDLLEPIDQSKLHFLSDLNPALMGHSFDPTNRYSIPFEWEVYGIGVNRAELPDFIPSWGALFDKNAVDYKVAMNNDPIEVVLFASLYLSGQTDVIDEKLFQRIRTLLLEQRSWVEAYTDFRADYFIATGNCPIALSISAFIKRIRRQYPHIDFVVPKEGSFITIENFCIPKESRKKEFVYKLLNHLYTKESAISHYENFWFFPALLSPIPDLDLNPYEQQLLKMNREDFNKFHFFKNVLPQQKVRDLWVEVKS